MGRKILRGSLVEASRAGITPTTRKGWFSLDFPGPVESSMMESGCAAAVLLLIRDLLWAWSSYIGGVAQMVRATDS